MQATDVEPWYGTPYSLERIDDLSVQVLTLLNFALLIFL
jgi:hypothetical protein